MRHELHRAVSVHFSQPAVLVQALHVRVTPHEAQGFVYLLGREPAAGKQVTGDWLPSQALWSVRETRMQPATSPQRFKVK